MVTSTVRQLPANKPLPCNQAADEGNGLQAGTCIHTEQAVADGCHAAVLQL